MAQKIADEPGQYIYLQIRDILEKSRSRVWRAVNSGMVSCYWEIGRVLVEEEQEGEEHAAYDKRIIADLSHKLTKDFGKGFNQ